MTRSTASGTGAGSQTRATNRLRKSTTATDGYFRRSELPLYSLVLVIPLLVIYEVGTTHFATHKTLGTESRIIAFTLLHDFFQMLGAGGKYLPGLALVCILLAWHIARQDPWRLRLGTLLGMSVEGLFLGLPLLGIGLLSLRYLSGSEHADWKAMVILSVGAGLYEELVFRLIVFTFLHLLLVDVFGAGRFRSAIVSVLAASLLFSLYHYLGVENFQWQSFAFRTVSGLYFGAIFLCRGFGITAYSHISYDICILLLRNLENKY